MTYSRTISFVDAARNRVKVTAKIGDNGRFSMTGEHGNNGGQIVKLIKPASDDQRELVRLWDEWHLNDMHAGTPSQEALLKAHGVTGYSEGAKFLSDRCMFCVTDAPDEVKRRHNVDNGWYENAYAYGTAWLSVELPEDFEDELDELLGEIEDASSDEPLTEESVDWDKVEEAFPDSDDANKAVALCLMLEASERALLEDTEVDDDRVTVEGNTYLCGTDNEMDERWDESLDNYLDECVLSELDGVAAQYFDRDAWKKDARHDGRAHSLNHHDGDEESICLDGEWFFAYRQ